MRLRHKLPNVFGLYMVDVLCCSLGCVILLWLFNDYKSTLLNKDLEAKGKELSRLTEEQRQRTEELGKARESLAKRDLVPVLTRQADLLRDDDDLLNELAGALDPTDALALAHAPIALSRRAIRSWLTNPLVPDSATVERVLEVARGNTLACDIGLGRQVRRSQQRLRITEAETSK